jgi:clan AA aspartic protease (TIGR02281 family)
MLSPVFSRTLFAALLVWSVCGSALAEDALPLSRLNGIYTLPVRINNAVIETFILDSGAAEVSISDDVANALVRLGAIQPRDYLIERVYTDASGHPLRRKRVLLRSVRIGNYEIRNVPASIGGSTGLMLLGQSFLNRLKVWSIDNRRQVLVISDTVPTFDQPTTPIDVNDKDSLGRTALHRAAANEPLALVKSLLVRGASVNEQDTAGWSALMFAVDRGDLEIAKALITADADVNLRNNSGWAPLLTAVSRGNRDMVQLLIAAKADVNVRNNDGWTALFGARSRNDLEMIRLLKQAGAVER